MTLFIYGASYRHEDCGRAKLSTIEAADKAAAIAAVRALIPAGATMIEIEIEVSAWDAKRRRQAATP